MIKLNYSVTVSIISLCRETDQRITYDDSLPLG